MIKSLVSGGSVLPLTIPSMEVAQLDTKPGFSVNGNFKIHLPEWIPPFTMDMGFLALDISTQSLPIATTTLPKGMNLVENAAPLAAELVLKPNISGTVQQFVDGLSGPEEALAKSNVGVTGFLLGTAEAQPLVTFSRIQIGFSAKTLMGIIKGTGSSMLSSLIVPGMVKVKGLDLEMQSSRALSTGLQSDILNPTNISLSTGAISLSLGLDKAKLVNIQMSPLGLKRGLGPMNIALALGFESVESIPPKVESLQISNFALVQGQSQIDMLAPVVFTIPVSLLTSLMASISEMPLEKSPLDLNAMIPTKDALLNLNPKIESAVLSVGSNSTLGAGLALLMNNPLPVTLKAPYLMTTITLGGSDSEVVNLQLSGLNLVRGQGPATFNTEMRFPQSQEIPTKVAALLSNFLQGRIDPSPGIKGISFGLSASDRNSMLSGFHLDLGFITSKLGFLGPQISTYVSDFIKSFLGDFLEKSQISLSVGATGGIAVQMAPGLSINVQALDVGVLPQKSIGLAIGLSLALPLNAQISIPVVGVSANVDDLPFVDMRIRGIQVKSPGPSAMALETVILIHDTESLAQKLTKLSASISQKSTIAEKLVLSGMFIGASDQDVIGTLSAVQLPLPIGSIVQVVLSVLQKASGQIDLVPILDALRLSLKGLTAKAMPGRTIQAGVDVGFGDLLKLSVSGLGYVSANVGLDVTDFLGMVSPGINLTTGQSVLSLGGKMKFVSSPEVQDKMAAFFANLASRGVGQTTEVISISGFTLGTSQQETISCFQGIRIGIPTSLLLNQKTMELIIGLAMKSVGSLSMKALLEALDLRRANLDVSVPDLIVFDTMLGLTGFPILVDLDIPFAVGAADFDRENLAAFAIPGGLKIVSAEKSLVTVLGANIGLGNSEKLQASLALFVDNVVKGVPVKNLIGVSGLVFGVSQQDCVDILAKASVHLAINSLIAPMKSAFSSIMATLSSGKLPFGFAVQSGEADIVRANTFGINGQVQLTGLKSDLSVNIPFGTITILVQGRLMTIPVMGLLMKQGNINLGLDIPCAKDDVIGMKITELLRNVVWHQPGLVKMDVSVVGLRFGASAEKSFALASRIKIPIPVAPVLKMVKKFVDTRRPIEIDEIYSKMNAEGISAITTMKGVAGNFPLKIGIKQVEANILYQLKGKGKMLHVATAFLDEFKWVPGKPMSSRSSIKPDLDPRNGAADSLREALPFLIAGKDFAKNARLGRFKITGSTGAVFDALGESYFQAPEILFWKPISVDVRLSEAPSSAGMLPIEVSISFPNKGPLHMELGEIVIDVLSAGISMATVTNGGSLIVKNQKELSKPGSQNPENAVFRTKLKLFEMNPADIGKNIMDILNPFKYSIKMDIRNPDGPVPWLDQMIAQIFTKNALVQFIPAGISFLSSIKYNFFGMKLGSNRKNSASLDGYMDLVKRPFFSPGPILELRNVTRVVNQFDHLLAISY